MAVALSAQRHREAAPAAAPSTLWEQTRPACVSQAVGKVAGGQSDRHLWFKAAGLAACL